MTSATTPEAPAATDRPYRLEQIDDAAVVQLYADGFAALSRDEKILVWHLYLAARAGRDIYYDQRHRHNLALRDILEEILTHGAGIPAPVLAELTRYTKLFWINTGPYNNLTARKFVLTLTRPQLVAAAETAAGNGARFRCDGGEAVAALIDRYVPQLLDPAVDPMVTCKTPGAGRDILQASANNLYEGVTMADLEAFSERHPLNARLVRRNGTLVEEVYRVGGRYDAEIRAIVGHLTDALPFAPASLAAALTALIRWYQTGEEADREAFDIAWVRNRDSAVDTMNGFIEVYMDARGTKGSWEGVVYYVNHEKTDKIQRLAEHAQWFEDHLPVEPRFRKPQVQGISARAIEVVFESGDSGPVTPIGVNLPNDQRIREAYGSKSVSLSNVIEAYEESTLDTFRSGIRLGRGGARARQALGGVRQRIDHRDPRGPRARVGPDGRRPGRAAAGAAEGTGTRPWKSRAPIWWRCTSWPTRTWSAWDWCRASTRPRSCAPSTSPTRATRWSSSAGSARARSWRKTTCATARPSSTG